MNTLPSHISELSVAEKFDLLDALWQDLEAGTPGLSSEQSAELDERMARYERDPSGVIPWEQVRADLIKR